MGAAAGLSAVLLHCERTFENNYTCQRTGAGAAHPRRLLPTTSAPTTTNVAPGKARDPKSKSSAAAFTIPARPRIPIACRSRRRPVKVSKSRKIFYSPGSCRKTCWSVLSIHLIMRHKAAFFERCPPYIKVAGAVFGFLRGDSDVRPRNRIRGPAQLKAPATTGIPQVFSPSCDHQYSFYNYSHYE